MAANTTAYYDRAKITAVNILKFWYFESRCDQTTKIQVTVSQIFVVQVFYLNSRQNEEFWFQVIEPMARDGLRTISLAYRDFVTGKAEINQVPML